MMINVFYKTIEFIKIVFSFSNFKATIFFENIDDDILVVIFVLIWWGLLAKWYFN